MEMQKNEGNNVIDEKPKWPKPKVGGNLRHKFSKQEDETLKRIVQQHGEGNWSLIASCMKNRTARQCRERYKNYLSPNIKNDPWTPEEELLLEKKYAELGPRWAKIALFFENRSDVNVKNHWTAMMNRQSREKMLNQDRLDMRQKYDTPIMSMIPIYGNPHSAMIAIPQAHLYQHVPVQQMQTIPIGSYGQIPPMGVPHSIYQYPPNMFQQGAAQHQIPPGMSSQFCGASIDINPNSYRADTNVQNTANKQFDYPTQKEPLQKTEEIHAQDLQEGSDGFSDLEDSFKFDTSFDLFDF